MQQRTKVFITFLSIRVSPSFRCHLFASVLAYPHVHTRAPILKGKKKKAIRTTRSIKLSFSSHKFSTHFLFYFISLSSSKGIRIVPHQLHLALFFMLERAAWPGSSIIAGIRVEEKRQRFLYAGHFHYITRNTYLLLRLLFHLTGTVPSLAPAGHITHCWKRSSNLKATQLQAFFFKHGRSATTSFHSIHLFHH